MPVSTILVQEICSLPEYRYFGSVLNPSTFLSDLNSTRSCEEVQLGENCHQRHDPVVPKSLARLYPLPVTGG
jgi:hypothetical protein